VADSRFALLDGKDAWIKTTQMGGIDKTGSIMAWVNLSALPKKPGHIPDKSGSTAKKSNQFTIGESPVFTGRFFPGGIDEVAIWDRALSPAGGSL